MEFLANPDLKNVAALSTTSSKVLVVDGANNTIKYRTPAQIITDGGGSSGGGRSFSILTAQDAGWAISNEAVSNNPGTALMIGDLRRYVVGFKPANVRVSFYQISTGNNSIGIRVQVSTSSTDWSSAVSSDVVYASYDAGADIMRTGSSTLSLSGSAPYYFRFLFYNNSGSTQSLSLKDLTAEFWN